MNTLKNTCIVIFVFALIFSCTPSHKSNFITWNEKSIGSEFSEVQLDNKTKAYITKTPGNRDAVIFLNPANQTSKELYIYSQLLFKSAGFNTLLLDYAPVDSINYTYEEITKKIRAGVNYLIKDSIAADRIILYGKDNTCILA